MNDYRPSTLILGKEKKEVDKLALFYDILLLIVVVFLIMWGVGYATVGISETAPFYTTPPAPGPELAMVTPPPAPTPPSTTA